MIPTIPKHVAAIRRAHDGNVHGFDIGVAAEVEPFARNESHDFPGGVAGQSGRSQIWPPRRKPFFRRQESSCSGQPRRPLIGNSSVLAGRLVMPSASAPQRTPVRAVLAVNIFRIPPYQPNLMVSHYAFGRASHDRGSLAQRSRGRDTISRAARIASSRVSASPAASCS